MCITMSYDKNYNAGMQVTEIKSVAILNMYIIYGTIK